MYIFWQDWRLQVFVHLGERSVCCCTAIGGSFAPQFICQQLGAAADSAAAAGPAALPTLDFDAASRAAEPAASAGPSPGAVQTQLEAISGIQKLFAGYGRRVSP